MHEPCPRGGRQDLTQGAAHDGRVFTAEQPLKRVRWRFLRAGGGTAQNLRDLAGQGVPQCFALALRQGGAEGAQRYRKCFDRRVVSYKGTQFAEPPDDVRVR